MTTVDLGTVRTLLCRSLDVGESRLERDELLAQHVPALVERVERQAADWARLRGVRDLLEQQRDQMYIALRALTDAALGLDAHAAEAARVMAVVNGVIPDTGAAEAGTSGGATAMDIASAIVWSAKACYRVEGGEPAEIMAAHHQLMADVAALYRFEMTGEVGTAPAQLDPVVEEAHAQRLDAQLAAAEARAVADRRVLDAAEALSAAVADFRRDGSVVLVHPDLEPFLAAVDAAVDARRALTGEQTEGA